MEKSFCWERDFLLGNSVIV